jgi:fructose-1,6-bisphosphatase/inositol monophosphatase family enzyme
MSQPDERSTTQIERYLQLFDREAGRQTRELQGHLDRVASKDGQELYGSSIVTEADGQIDRFVEEFFPRVFPRLLVIQEETAG